MASILIQVSTFSIKEIGTFVYSHAEWLYTVAIIPAFTYGKKLYKYYREMQDLRKTIPQINGKLDSLLLEFTANGGGSLRDQVNRIERRGILTQQLAWQSREDSVNGEFVTDSDGSWTRVNKTLLKMVDAQDFQVTGNGWLGFISDKDAESSSEKYSSAIKEKRGVSFPCHLRRGDDVEWSVIFTIEPLRNDGSIVGFLGKIVKKN